MLVCTEALIVNLPVGIYSKSVCKQLEKGVNDLSLVDLSIVKPLAAELLFQTYNDIKADTKLIYKGFERTGIAESIHFLIPVTPTKYFGGEILKLQTKISQKINVFLLVQNR